MRPAMTAGIAGGFLAAVVAFGPAAAAQTPAEPPEPAMDRLERVAAAFDETSFYVDPDASYRFDEGQVERIRSGLDALDFPVYLVALPLHPDDESGGEEYLFLQHLHTTVGEDGVYVVVDTRTDFIYLDNYRAPVTLGRYDVSHEIRSASRDARPVGERTIMLVDELASAEPGEPDRPPSPEEPAEPESTDASTISLVGGGAGVGGFLGLVLFGMLQLGIALVDAARRRGRAVDRVVDEPFGDLRAPTVPSAKVLEHTTKDELARLEAALAAARRATDPPTPPDVDEYAARCYDAAGLVNSERFEPIDRVGVVVLARLGRLALFEGSLGRTTCYLNPLHPPAERATTVPRKLPGENVVRSVPLCSGCRGARKGALFTRVLQVDQAGQLRAPYYLATGWWGENGFNPGTDLPDRVLERLGVT